MVHRKSELQFYGCPLDRAICGINKIEADFCCGFMCTLESCVKLPLISFFSDIHLSEPLIDRHYVLCLYKPSDNYLYPYLNYEYVLYAMIIERNI